MTVLLFSLYRRPITAFSPGVKKSAKRAVHGAEKRNAAVCQTNALPS